MKLNNLIRVLQAALIILGIAVPMVFLGGIYFISGFIQPFVDLTAYTVEIVVLYFLITTTYSLIVYRKCKNIKASDLIEVNQRTATTDTQKDIELVEVSIKSTTGLASMLKYMHTVTVTPNSDSPHSWMEIAVVENKGRKEEQSVCFVVDTTKEELNGNTSFTDATKVVYPEEKYTELNSTYNTLESLQFYDQSLTKITEYTVE